MLNRSSCVIGNPHTTKLFWFRFVIAVCVAYTWMFVGTVLRGKALQFNSLTTVFDFCNFPQEKSLDPLTLNFDPVQKPRT